MFVNSITLEPFEISSWNFYGSKIRYDEKHRRIRKWLHSDTLTVADLECGMRPVAPLLDNTGSATVAKLCNTISDKFLSIDKFAIFQCSKTDTRHRLRLRLRTLHTKISCWSAYLNDNTRRCYMQLLQLQASICKLIAEGEAWVSVPSIRNCSGRADILMCCKAPTEWTCTYDTLAIGQVDGQQRTLHLATPVPSLTDCGASTRAVESASAPPLLWHTPYTLSPPPSLCTLYIYFQLLITRADQR